MISKENETNKTIGVDLATNRKGQTVIFMNGRMCGKTTMMEAMKNVENIPGIKFEEASDTLSNFKKSLDNNEIKITNPTYQDCLNSIEALKDKLKYKGGKR